MFKRIITYTGFWKSVLGLGSAFGAVYFLIRWAMAGFSFEELTPTPRLFIGWALTSLFYGFVMTFIKFRTKIKEKDAKNK